MIQLLFPLLVVGAAMTALTPLSPRFSTGCLLTVASMLVAFATLLGLALGHCAVAECQSEEINRPLWALGIVIGTVAANIAMWFVIARAGKDNK